MHSVTCLLTFARFACVVSCFLLAIDSIPAQPVPATDNRAGVKAILEQGQQGWSELKAKTDGFECTVHEDKVVQGESSSTVLVFKVQKPWLFQHEIESKGKSAPTDAVTAQNGKYSFQLKGANSKDWILKLVAPTPSDIAKYQFRNYLNSYVELPYSVTYESLPDLIKDPAFRIVNFVAESEKEARLDFERPLNAKQRYGPRKGTVWFHSDLSWAVDRYKAEYGTADAVEDEVEASVQYGNFIGGAPVILRHVFSTKPPNSPDWTKREFVFTNWTYRSIPEDEFKLGAFGIDETGFAKSANSGTSGMRLGLILINVAIVLVLCSAFIYRRFGAP